jgi:hypothetical protein
MQALRQKFFTLAGNILNFEADNRQQDHSRTESVARRAFWEQLYKVRDSEMEALGSFLESDASILLVTGQVGTGKSTLIRYHVEHRQQYTTVLMDFRRWIEELADNSRPVAESLRLIIRESYKNALEHNFRETILSGRDHYANLLYRDSAQLTTGVTNADWYAPELQAQVRIRIAAEAVYRLRMFDDFYAFLTREMPALPGSNPAALRAQLTESQAFAIGQAMTWEHYLFLFRRLDDRNLPCVLVFDNMDRIPLEQIQRDLFSGIISILGRVNRTMDAPFSERRGDPPVKAIVAIRNENISRIAVESGAGKRVEQIKLTANGYSVKGIRAVSLVQQSGFSMSVIEARLRYLAASLPLHFKEADQLAEVRQWFDLYDGFIAKCWLREEDGQLIDHLGNFKVRELCNGSLRQMLLLVHQSTLDFLTHSERQHLSIDVLEKNLSATMLRGHLIRSLWQADDSQKVMQAFAKSLKEESDLLTSCLLRLILVYLERQPDKQCPAWQLYDAFIPVYGFDKARYQERLFTLYNTGQMESDLINIYQTRVIRVPDDIADDAIIHLNGKGLVFVESVVINIDFFGGAVNNQPDSMYKTLHQRNLREAVDYAEAVYQFVVRTIEQQQHTWQQLVLPNLELTNGRRPYEIFAERFTLKQGFHFERVCMSHRFSLKNYILEVLKGPEAGLLLSNQELERLPPPNPNDPLTDLHLDEPLRHYLTRYFPANHLLHRLWDVYHNYEQYLNQLQYLREADLPPATRRLAELADTWLKKGDLSRAIGYLNKVKWPDETLVSQFVLLQSRDNNIQRGFDANLMTLEDYYIQKARVTSGVQNLIATLLA